MHLLMSIAFLVATITGRCSATVTQTSTTESATTSTSLTVTKTRTILKTDDYLSETTLPAQAVPKGPTVQNYSCNPLPRDSSGNNLTLSVGAYPNGTFQPRNAWELLNSFCLNTTFFQLQDPNYGFYAIGPGNEDAGVVVQLNANYSLNRTNGNDYTDQNFNKLCFTALSTVFYNCAINGTNSNSSSWLDYPMVGGTYTAGDVEFDLFPNNNSIVPKPGFPRGGYASLPRPENNLGQATPITSGTVSASNTFLGTYDYVISVATTVLTNFSSTPTTFVSTVLSTVPSQLRYDVFRTAVVLSSEAWLNVLDPVTRTASTAD